jgi:DNA-binding response OmpR family regulator
MAQNPAQIFIVEDNDPDVFLVEEALRSHGLEVKFQRSYDGEHAIRTLGEMDPAQLPDIILIDLNLPKINGIEVLKHVRSQRYLDRVPVLILTSSQSHVDRALALKHGADAYIAKPPTLPEFLATVGSGIRRLLERTDSAPGTANTGATSNLARRDDVCWYDRSTRRCSKLTISRRVTATLSRSMAYRFARAQAKRSGF